MKQLQYILFVLLILRAMEDIKKEIIEQTANESYQKFLRIGVRSSHHATPNPKHRGQRKRDQYYNYSSNIQKKPISIKNVPKSFLQKEIINPADLRLNTHAITNENDNDINNNNNNVINNTTNNHVKLKSTKRKMIRPSSSRLSYRYSGSQQSQSESTQQISMTPKRKTSVSMTNDAVLFRKFGIHESSAIMRKLFTKEKVISFLYNELFAPKSCKKKQVLSQTSKGQSIQQSPPRNNAKKQSSTTTEQETIDENLIPNVGNKFEHVQMQKVHSLVDSTFGD